MAKDFEELTVWKRAHELTLAVYKATESFPERERYGLTQQLQRAASSVSANIVEGYHRDSQRDFSHFLNLAQGSLGETRYHLLLARDLGYLASEHYQALASKCTEVAKLLHAFRRGLKRSFH